MICERDEERRGLSQDGDLLRFDHVQSVGRREAGREHERRSQ